MTRSEVMAMTDEQLIVTAYEITHPGKTVTAFEVREMGPSVKIQGNATAWFECPDFPNGWEAAGGLIDYMQRIPEGGGPRLEIVLGSDVDEWQCQVGYEGWPCGPVAIGYADTAKRAITRAFVLAMGAQ